VSMGILDALQPFANGEGEKEAMEGLYGIGEAYGEGEDDGDGEGVWAGGAGAGGCCEWGGGGGVPDGADEPLGPGRC
jgi:hypothetical protein